MRFFYFSSSVVQPKAVNDFVGLGNGEGKLLETDKMIVERSPFFSMLFHATTEYFHNIMIL